MGASSRTAADLPDGTDRTAVLVAFPVSACTGSDSAVFIDERGHFIGSVSPGTAAVLPLP